MLGSTKLKIHMSKTIAKMTDSLTSKNEKMNIATEPFTTTSKSESIGIIDAIKYIAKILVMASR